MRASSAVPAPRPEQLHSVYNSSDDLNVLRCAAIYGANASGKSNLIEALLTAQQIVTHGGESLNSRFDIQPFLLDEAARKSPSAFEFYLLLEGAIYGYRFSASTKEIVSESLHRVDAGRETPIFTREEGIFDFSPELSSNSQEPKFLEFVAKGTPKNRLFIQESLQRNVEAPVIRSLFDWLSNCITVIQPSSRFHDLTRMAASDPDFMSFLTRALTWADTGIRQLQISRRAVDDETRNRINEFVNEPKLKSFLPLLGPHPSRETLIETDGRLEVVSLRSKHSDSPDSPTFGLEDESDGTLRLLDLVPMLYLGAKSTMIFVVDELDRSLHTLIAKRLMEAFMQTLPSHSTQLIFTTHDTNLLDCRALRPDCIWFTEKNDTGSTSLFSLADFRQDQLVEFCDDLENGYLRGRFGGIPFLGDPTSLGWFQDEQSKGAEVGK